MLLGVAYHATVSWLPGIEPWYFVADSSPVAALSGLSGFLHAFRMQLFFALSGFFSHLVFERRGAADFLRERSRRLLVPMLFALPVVLLLDVGLRSMSARLGVLSPSSGVGASFRLAPLHLWFLIYVWMFCAAAWALPSFELPERALRTALRFPPSLLLLTGLTGLGLVWHPENRPDEVLWPRPFEAFHYGLFFAFGWWAWKAREALASLRPWGPWFLAAGVALGVRVFGTDLQWRAPGHFLSAVVAWLMTLGALGVAVRVPAAERPVLRFLVASSYWVYLMHYSVIFALQLWFAQRQWPGVVEWLLTVVLTLALGLSSFSVLVRKTWLAPWLGAAR
jgi:glucans biosynthesis protein C